MSAIVTAATATRAPATTHGRPTGAARRWWRRFDPPSDGDRRDGRLQGRGRWARRLRGDPVPQLARGVAAHVAEHAGDLAVLGELGRAAGALLDVGRDEGGLLLAHRVERVGAEELCGLVVVHVASFEWSVRCTASERCIRWSPARILDLTVPSGSPSSDATSR